MICEAGELRPSTENIGELEKPVLWMSFNQMWEATANKMIKDEKTGNWRWMTAQETCFNWNGLVRLGKYLARRDLYFEDAEGKIFYSWPDVAIRAGIEEKLEVAMEDVAREVDSNTKDWIGTFESMPIQELDIFEFFDPSTRDWVEFDEKLK